MRLFLFSFVFVAVTCSAAEQVKEPPPGLVLVARASGLTEKGAGQARPLRVNDSVPVGRLIQTDHTSGSGAVLVFSNGAVLSLSAATALRIETFTQQPFAATVTIADMTMEPSVSQARITILRGEVIGLVRGLRAANGSVFAIKAGAREVNVDRCSFSARLMAGTDRAEIKVVRSGEKSDPEWENTLEERLLVPAFGAGSRK
ncbi:MAG: hypothetical protein Q7S40_15745 [Opitutaceae bacterium]|nr:hypothetical protein [Opitutaceae bacterium]